MICQRCQRHLRNYEGVKCDQCESRFHLRCVNGIAKDHCNSGDRAYQWKCALCQNSETKIRIEDIVTKDETVFNAIKALSEKFELVNKIQLPKLSNDLIQLKSIAEKISKQNEEILIKFDKQLSKKHKEDNKGVSSSRSRNYRKRNLNLSTNNTEKIPMLPLTEKTARYRPRRRSYLLNKMFHLLDRKLQKTTPKKKR